MGKNPKKKSTRLGDRYKDDKKNKFIDEPNESSNKFSDFDVEEREEKEDTGLRKREEVASNTVSDLLSTDKPKKQSVSLWKRICDFASFIFCVIQKFFVNLWENHRKALIIAPISIVSATLIIVGIVALSNIPPAPPQERYFVEYYLEDLTGEYELDKRNSHTAEVGKSVNAQVLSYEHFTIDEGKSVLQGIIDDNGELTLKVYYKRKDYQINIVTSNNLGNISGDGLYSYGESVTINATPKQGYVFAGWYNGETLISNNERYTFSVDKELSLTTKWTAKTYTVSFDSDGGSAVADMIATYNKAFTLPDKEPTKKGYTFGGWYNGGTQYNGGLWQRDSGLTLKAKWTARTYTVSFDSDGGSAVADMTATYAQEFTLPKAPTKIGYTFDGWYDGGTQYKGGFWQRDSGLTLKAKWTARTYTVSFDSDGGSAVEDMSVTYDQEFTLPDKKPTKMFYNFAGWYEGETQYNGEFWQRDSGLTLKAKWIKDTNIENFTYTSTETTCEITGVKDETITSITIPEYVTSIVDWLFSGCSSLTSITIPNSVTNIGICAFMGCFSLTEIVVDENNPNYSSLDGNLYDKNKTTLLRYAGGKTATSFVISNSVTSIGYGAFDVCSSLESITIPNSVTSIGDYAFFYCRSLTSVAIPNSVTSIGIRAFDSCSGLTSITIPDSVTSIGDRAFYGCNRLTIYCKATSKPSGWSSDWNSSGCPVRWGYTGN